MGLGWHARGEAARAAHREPAGPRHKLPAWRHRPFALVRAFAPTVVRAFPAVQVGRLVALAVVRRTPLSAGFSRCLYKLLLAERFTASDVARIDQARLMNPDPPHLLHPPLTPSSDTLL